jgi:hypothetical protein
MKYSGRFLSVALGGLILAVGTGCAGLKEAGKGFVGVSTKIVEEGRADSLKKSFALDHARCYTKVKAILSQKDKESYIYAQDVEQKIIALYLSTTDTTPVGIFFTSQADGHTLIEVSSPSFYAKEEIAGRIFAGLDELINPKTQEKKADVKEKTDNQ